ncbi:hypothetical protein NEUTE1DRAFT_116083 [Neurospora tetrasperma FGSC 2508]|uniref:Uncharacterized protein n=1 Tax=Neurospora tetrasperma (strain FGSC 2508 / ATCC MYA-4615 / P0657) TaxID=510951 RepID=F8MD36_NEUT8|nr:uncharacterized protein NEUTE1DRAFT_116083 [Neurospora tetrasperma FGSC 2508]EGO61381.1 hypothetical protein NEUTE1DRAFT_116083 [Neurospora tetrasperma FGSC 2508]EGZ74592.1 hypothetical protein NEUTE2DRAFT_143400 [Neurospora tetrasperma FGSC 2509]
MGDGESCNKGDEQVAGPAQQSLWSLVGSGRGRAIARWKKFEYEVSYHKDIISVCRESTSNS